MRTSLPDVGSKGNLQVPKATQGLGDSNFGALWQSLQRLGEGAVAASRAATGMLEVFATNVVLQNHERRHTGVLSPQVLDLRQVSVQAQLLNA
eukprot:1726652-Amphidinium_carterae.1